MNPQMTPFHCVIHRGGTSKAIFLMENELPRDPDLRDEVIRQIFGSPDRRQIDGLGGADVLTSKLAIIGPSNRPDADVTYTFAQVSFDTNLVDYNGNCGNISSAVGPFAIDEGLVPAVEPMTTVRIYQTNTDCILSADVQVENGKAKVEGDTHIDGVPGTGSPVLMNFFDSAGSTTGKVLPTGNAKDTLRVAPYGDFTVSIVDAGNVVVFIDARDLGLSGTESCSAIEADKKLCETIEAIRSSATVHIGLAATREEATAKHAYAPFFAMVSPPNGYSSEITGSQIAAQDVDIVSRLMFMLHMHKTYPGTGAVATGAAARIPGTVVHDVLRAEAAEQLPICIGHPGGIMVIESAAREGRPEPEFTRLAYVRTARRIMEGTVWVRNSAIK